MSCFPGPLMPDFLATKGEFDAFLRRHPVAIVDYTASWCGPCKMMAPVFEGLAKEFPTVGFCKVWDVYLPASMCAGVGVYTHAQIRKIRGHQHVHIDGGKNVLWVCFW